MTSPHDITEKQVEHAFNKTKEDIDRVLSSRGTPEEARTYISIHDPSTPMSMESGNGDGGHYDRCVEYIAKKTNTTYLDKPIKINGEWKFFQ